MIGNDFFRPKSIAIIGASAKPEKIGFSLVKNLLDGRFGGKVYPVNFNEQNILGLKCYPSVLAIPDRVELAIIAIPAASVVNVISECGQKKIGYAIIISSGFSETGPAGRLLQEEIQRVACQCRVRILGPNCLGMISPTNRLNASFSLNMPEKKNIAVISQSGATCTAILDWANKKGVGFSHFVSMGNKIDLNENDFLSYFAEDKNTSVVLGYLESISDGPKLLELARKLTRKKPFILLKSGTSQPGQKAARSHTAAMAADDLVLEEAFQEAGIIRARTLEEMFEWSLIFSEIKLPASGRIMIITNAGGPAVMATDAVAESRYLNFFDLDRKQKENLTKNLPDRINVTNPLDLQGDATSEDFLIALKGLKQVRGKEPDLKLILLTPQSNTDIEKIARVLVENKDNKTVVVFLGGQSFDQANSILAEAKIPSFLYPESAVHALSQLSKYARYAKQEKPAADYVKGIEKVADKIMKLDHPPSDAEVAKLLSAYRIPMADSKLTTNANEAVKAASEIGYPVVLKVTSPDILHKTEAGAIKLGIGNEEELRCSYQEILKNAKKHYPSAQILGITIYKMVRSSLEVAIGAKRDPIFGPFVMFSLGGIYIEILKDFQIRLAPVSTEEALEMIKSIKSFALLAGYRGGEKFDLESASRAISGLSRLMIDFPQISEVDINPIRLDKKSQGILALDAKVIFNSSKNY